jgi:hypothetical protein
VNFIENEYQDISLPIELLTGQLSAVDDSTTGSLIILKICSTLYLGETQNTILLSILPMSLAEK